MNELQAYASRICAIRDEIETPGASSLPCFMAASDLHGNVSRLNQMLAVARQQRVQHIFLVGDIYFGPGAWSLYQTLRPLIDQQDDAAVPITPLWGNHELAFVAGMLGNDNQLRFSYGFGGQQLIEEMNAALKDKIRPVTIQNTATPSKQDLATVRENQQLREMARWIQQTHCILAHDSYGTGYMHACPKITTENRMDIQYRARAGVDAIELIERDLARAERADDPVFAPLLQTARSPLWCLYEITSAKQFDATYYSAGIRQLVFGHRHRALAVNVGCLNRQIGIAVDFDKGLGGYLLISSGGLVFHSFVKTDSHDTEARQLTVPEGNLDSSQTHLRSVEEFLIRQTIDLQTSRFKLFSINSRQNQVEFKHLENLCQDGHAWIHRLYAEVYPHVRDLSVRKAMFSQVVDSSDEEAFKSLIHLLHRKTRQLQSHGGDWYDESYVNAKTDVQVMLQALREMPVRRLGLLDTRLRGTTSRINLTELYQKLMKLQDPELALMAVSNLGLLNYGVADQELRSAFFHDTRKVRVCAAEALAERGEVAYPLVKSLIASTDNWVRFLAFWTVSKLGEQDGGMGAQAISDIRCALANETDWLILTAGNELLRKLGDLDSPLSPSEEIPNLTQDVVERLQGIVDSQQEPFRRSFKVYFITVALSSLVYRRGLIGLDLDELRVYVNNADYFPPHYRYYKSATRDHQGQWMGWRRLWIRGETFNRPDGPQIVELKSDQLDAPPMGPDTIVLYNHETHDCQVRLPPLDAIIDKFGIGKSKDRVRDVLLQHWNTAFSDTQKGLLSRLHAAATVKMLFDLPSEVFLTKSEFNGLEEMTRSTFVDGANMSKPLLSLGPDLDVSGVVASANWLDASKYPVRIHLLDCVES